MEKEITTDNWLMVDARSKKHICDWLIMGVGAFYKGIVDGKIEAGLLYT